MFLLLISAFLNLNAQQVTVDKLPVSTDEFIQLRNTIAQTPEGGVTMFLVAMKIYSMNPELGEKCFVLAVDRGSLTSGNTYKGFSLLKFDMQLIKNQMAKDKNLTNSYIKGSSPNNSYKVKLPYIFTYSTNSYSGDKEAGPYKLFVKCSGADSPRPITVKRNDKGIWKAVSWSSVLVGIKKVPVSDDL